MDPEFRAPVSSDLPALFISGALDARTPVENAEEVAARFSNARHLVITDGGHDDDLLIGSPEIGEAIMAFFEGRAPAADRRIRIGDGP